MGIGRLRERRKLKGLTLGQVAKYEGITPQYLSSLELGVRMPSTWGLLQRLAQRYGCSTDYLLGLSDDPTPWAEGELSPELRKVRDLAADLSVRRQRELIELVRGMLAAQAEERQALARELATVSLLLNQIEELAGGAALQRLIPVLERITDWDQEDLVTLERSGR